MKTKFFILLSSILFIGANSFAQSSDPIEVIAKNRQFIAGDFSFNFQSSTNDIYSYPTQKITSFNLGPQYGKYFKDNLAWGSTIGYSFYETKVEGGDPRSYSHGIFLGVFLTKNYKIVNNLFFELEPNLLVTNSVYTTKNSNIDIKTKEIGLGLNISPGLLFFMTSNFGMSASLGSLGYYYRKSKLDGSDLVNKAHFFRVNGGLSNINFSLRYFFS